MLAEKVLGELDATLGEAEALVGQHVGEELRHAVATAVIEQLEKVVRALNATGSRAQQALAIQRSELHADRLPQRGGAFLLAEDGASVGVLAIPRLPRVVEDARHVEHLDRVAREARQRAIGSARERDDAGHARDVHLECVVREGERRVKVVGHGAESNLRASRTSSIEASEIVAVPPEYHHHHHTACARTSTSIDFCVPGIGSDMVPLVSCGQGEKGTAGHGGNSTTYDA